MKLTRREQVTHGLAPPSLLGPLQTPADSALRPVKRSEGAAKQKAKEPGDGGMGGGEGEKGLPLDACFTSNLLLSLPCLATTTTTACDDTQTRLLLRTESRLLLVLSRHMPTPLAHTSPLLLLLLPNSLIGCWPELAANPRKPALRRLNYS